MSDNVFQTPQEIVQDVIAPDLRETKVRLESLGKETATRLKSVEARFDTVDAQFQKLEKQMASMKESIPAAHVESRAQSDLAIANAVSPLRERIAVLESRHK